MIFQEKYFSHYVLLTDQISFSDCFYFKILDNILSIKNCLLTRLRRRKTWINLNFLIKPFCYMTKKSRQKFKYLENEKRFWGEIKSIFYHFSSRAFSCQKLSQTWECTFKWLTRDKKKSISLYQLSLSGAYSELCRTSEMESFAKIANQKSAISFIEIKGCRGLQLRGWRGGRGCASSVFEKGKEFKGWRSLREGTCFPGF